MDASEWERRIEVAGEVYTARFIKRPFREGIEVRVDHPAGTISVAEMGLGEQALLERVVRLILDRKV